MAHKMKSINKRLDEIDQAKDKFGLVHQESNMPMITVKREKAHAFVSATDTIIGRVEDKKKVIYRLSMDIPIDECDEGDIISVIPIAGDEETKISVIPIVGIGGVGKTTLAKLVYNDPEIRLFDLKFWICVSFDFGVRKLIEEIVKSATKGPAGDETNYSSWDMESLLSLFRKTVEGKKYLLVLDDVWNEDRMKWNELEAFLRMGANGSKILVTTRSSTVASIVSSIPPINLEGLPHEECMILFKKTAFKGEQKDVENYEKLMQIGEEIVKKCKGVPLAVVTVGAVLSTTRSKTEWKKIRDSEVWEIKQKDSHILPSLKLSYEQLTTPVRRCFAYCAAFPKSYVFTDFDLIPFWISHGLVEFSRKDSEDVAIEYIEELRSKGLLQEVQIAPGLAGLEMHDLVHDLALSIAENEFYMVTRINRQSLRNARHVFFQDSQSLHKNKSSILHNRSVRSFGKTRNVQEMLSESTISVFLPGFKYLRFLDLSNSGIKVLPKSISILKHLRYLDLEGNDEIIRLPSYICKLYCLQALFFHRCKGMKEFPRHLRYFISLRYLGITTKQKVLPEGGLGSLGSLQSLLIMECENLEYLCEDFGLLSCLRRLKIHKCERLISLPNGMNKLHALRDLLIYNCSRLKQLPELPSLEKFVIRNCRMLRKRCIETRQYWPEIEEIPEVYFDDDIKISNGVVQEISSGVE